MIFKQKLQALAVIRIGAWNEILENFILNLSSDVNRIIQAPRHPFNPFRSTLLSVPYFITQHFIFEEKKYLLDKGPKGSQGVTKI